MSRLGLAFALVVVVLMGTAFFGYMLRASLDDDDDGVARAAAGTSPADALAATTDAFPPFDGFTESYVGTDDRCLRVVIADESDERVQGLRGVSDLGNYDGMLFVFGEDSHSSFTMADTLIPLDIGWYDANGDPVDRTVMQPCPDAEVECPPYAARGPYRYALETEAGSGGGGSIGACPS
ncbi:MAG: DUF192 domain-containing protein [Actinomycetota bacterium]|nr:DUF192 domain-containing protein [Actinomycetota bacterium]